MTPEQLSALLPDEVEMWERCEAATSGPWGTKVDKHDNWANNARFIANARTDLSATLETIAQLRLELAAAQKITIATLDFVRAVALAESEIPAETPDAEMVQFVMGVGAIRLAAQVIERIDLMEVSGYE